MQGVGGTRYCDWWFTDEAVLIDTAGRYTTQDSDAKADRKSWLAFLDMLRAEPAAPADQRRHRRDQHRRRSQPVGDGGGRARRRDPQAPRRTARGTEGRLPGLRRLHQDGSRSSASPNISPISTRPSARRSGARPSRPPTRRPTTSARFPRRSISSSSAFPSGCPSACRTSLTCARARSCSDFRRRSARSESRSPTSSIAFSSRRAIRRPRRCAASISPRERRRARRSTRVIGALQKSYGVESLGSRRLFGRRQELLPARPADESDLRRGRLGLDQHRRGAPIVRPARRRVRADRARDAGDSRLVVDELYAQRRAHRRRPSRASTTTPPPPARFIKQNSVTDPNLRPIYELIDASAESAGRLRQRATIRTPVDQTFGLSQRPRLQDASNDLYRQALERLMRPRLILSLEQQIQKNIDDPSFVYEALKVYLMLGRQGAEVDKDLILDWFTRDWEERMFPGAPNAQGRALLRAASRRHARHGRRAGEEDFAQRPAGRAGAGDACAHARRRARLYAAEVRGAQCGGRGLARVPARRPRHGPGVRGGQRRQPRHRPRSRLLHLSTASTAALLDAFADDRATSCRRTTGCSAPSGDQNAVKQQFASLYPGILELYGRDFIAAWTRRDQQSSTEARCSPTSRNISS